MTRSKQLILDEIKMPWRKNFVLAAPSWVIAGGIKENALFLAGKVDEVSLCFFELQACLNYSEAELPQSLQELPLTWQMHLPFDLSQNPEQAAEQALALLNKVSFLNIKGLVLHPFTGKNAVEKLQIFIEHWQKAGQASSLLWLENTKNSDLLEFIELAEEQNFGFCLDIGHLLAYSQNDLIQKFFQSKSFCAKIKQLHLSLPGNAANLSKHLPLLPKKNASKEQEALLENLSFLPYLLKQLQTETRLQPELFAWQDYLASLVGLNEYFE